MLGSKIDMSGDSLFGDPPFIQPISKVVVPEVRIFHTDNHIPVYPVRLKGMGIVFGHLVFAAGRPYEHKKCVAATCAPLMKKGAGAYDAQALSERIEFLGGSLSVAYSLDDITIKFMCLHRHFSAICELVGSIVSEPRFDPKELDRYIRHRLERLKLELARSSNVSYRHITEQIFGENHPYGYNSTADLLKEVNIGDLRAHFDRCISSDRAQMFFCGDIGQSEEDVIHDLSAKIAKRSEPIEPVHHIVRQSSSQRCFRMPSTSSQTAIMLGRPTFTYNHEDFLGLQYLSNLLGGFFGSRLISNIREDKGLTYGIYAVLDLLTYDGSLLIGCEVSEDNVDKVLDEVYKEMHLLRTTLVQEEEINLLINYLRGRQLSNFDGAMNTLMAIKGLVSHQFPLDNITAVMDRALAFSADDIQMLAQKYLDQNDFWEVVVGPNQEERKI